MRLNKNADSIRVSEKCFRARDADNIEIYLLSYMNRITMRVRFFKVGTRLFDFYVLKQWEAIMHK